MPKTVVSLVALLAVGGAMAQSSSSFKLEEHAFNAGGHPDHGTTPQSASSSMDGSAPGTSRASPHSFRASRTATGVTSS